MHLQILLFLNNLTLFVAQEISISNDWLVLYGYFIFQDHIGSLNWGYRVSLRDKNVEYHNSYGEFIGPHKIKVSGLHLIRFDSLH